MKLTDDERNAVLVMRDDIRDLVDPDRGYTVPNELARTNRVGLAVLERLLDTPVGEQSDGYHTFNELYEHRIALFLSLCAYVQDAGSFLVWRSKVHSDGTMFDGWFIVGIGVEPGEQITYHLPLSSWDETRFIAEFDQATMPAFDGHTSADVLKRLQRFYR